MVVTTLTSSTTNSTTTTTTNTPTASASQNEAIDSGWNSKPQEEAKHVITKHFVIQVVVQNYREIEVEDEVLFFLRESLMCFRRAVLSPPFLVVLYRRVLMSVISRHWYKFERCITAFSNLISNSP